MRIEINLTSSLMSVETLAITLWDDNLSEPDVFKIELMLELLPPKMYTSLRSTPNS